MPEKEKLTLDFSPLTIYTIETPEQIKAFTDPLRIRVLGVLRDHAATNQQIADELGEAHSKVLYHVRYLLDAGLIKLVDSQVKGGNVEKYYRAIARIFDIRPASVDVERDVGLVKPALDRTRAEMLASVTLYPAFRAFMHTRIACLPEARIAEFDERLRALMAEYWDGSPPVEGEENARLAIFLYRDPGDLTH